MKSFFKIASAFLSGSLFAIGLGLGGMLEPKNVFEFLDITGDWKPGLAFVMLGAIPVYFFAHQISVKRNKPFFETDWSHLPKVGWDLPKSAKWGSALFGMGWGLSGLCPGPALVSSVTLQPGVLVFGASMILGFLIFDKVKLFHGH